MTDTEAIVEKIKKLLSLATSSNEHEAQLAASRASELLMKHNLNLNDVQEEEKFSEENIIEGFTIKHYQHLILNILKTFFFVHPFIYTTNFGHIRSYNRKTVKKRTVLIGRPENVAIAKYVYIFLDRIFLDLWKKYKMKNDVSYIPKAKNSYMHGLFEGLFSKLEGTKKKVEQETGLVIVPNAALEKYIEEKSDVTIKMQSSKVNKLVYSDGIQDGKKINIQQTLESKSDSETKRLGAPNGK